MLAEHASRSDGLRFVRRYQTRILANPAELVGIFAQSDLLRHSRTRLNPAAHVSPQQLEVIVADLVAPRRHRGRLAIEHRFAEALEIVLGKLAQVEGDAAGIDHIAAVAGHAEVVIHLAPEIGVVRSRGGGESHANRQRQEDPRTWTLRAWRASHAQTFFCRSAAT